MSPGRSRWADYFYPGTQTLKNVPGIRDAAALQKFETSAVVAREIQLRTDPPPRTFTVEHYTAIHRHLFQDVYPWAGRMRAVEVSKGDTDFAPMKTPTGLDLTAQGKLIMNALGVERHLTGLGKEQFVTRLTHHLTELNYWHPFREGNGRTMRIFLSQVAENAGYSLDFSKANTRDWAHASEQATSIAHFLNQVPMRAILRDVVTPHRARAFAQAHRTRNYGDAVAKHPELEGAFGTLERLRTQIREHTPGLAYEEQTRKVNAVAAKLQKRLHEGQVPTLHTPEQALKLIKDLNLSRSG